MSNYNQVVRYKSHESLVKIPSDLLQQTFTTKIYLNEMRKKKKKYLHKAKITGAIIRWIIVVVMAILS